MHFSYILINLKTLVIKLEENKFIHEFDHK